MADPRLLAVRTIGQVLDGRSLDRVLAATEPDIDERDRALAAELSYGVCRWYRRLDALVARLLRQPFRPRDRDLHTLLLVGAYQLLHSRVPAHAALSTTVDCTRRLGKPWASRLVNGVLRRLQRERADLEADLDRDPATRWALPDWLYESLGAARSGHADALCEVLQQRAPMWLRVDTARIGRPAYAERLGAEGLTARPHPSIASALALDRPVPVERLPGFADGLVSVQDAGAQLAAPLLDLAPGQRVLDACAAPGGKTLHLLQHCPDLRLTAVDVDAQRLRRVADNLRRGGVSATLVAADAAQPDGADWAAEGFDRILLDAPCSATGVLRRHPDIRLLRRDSDIENLAGRQAALLDALWPLLRPGGRLLYVTCSLLSCENAAQVDAFLGRHGGAVAVMLDPGVGTRSGVGVQLWPDVDETDGFYYAALCKPSADGSS
jgi:16S rRNA (cytosine967-C5)-methyltransferase